MLIKSSRKVFMANAKVEWLFGQYPWLRTLDKLTDKAITHRVQTFDADSLKESVGKFRNCEHPHNARGYLVSENGSHLGNIHDNAQGLAGWFTHLASRLGIIDDVSEIRTVLEAVRGHIQPDEIRFVVIVKQMHHLSEYILIEVFKLPQSKKMSDFLPPCWPRSYSEPQRELVRSKSGRQSVLTD